ncbi:MAG: Tol-Pal system beta propeller repeat protein TolB [Proteobacteria bacterium]|nr:Tol-Pal system beta propeller repeat protein TolB [Pseudomonadota bacterium]NOG60752.1 Tol-Pal system beta propeller repeat protein TolB [Pseudomonadota bacterium]
MKLFFRLLIISCLFLTTQTHAVLDIKITQGIEQSLPIAIVPFGWSQASSVAPIDLTSIISEDLQRSGRFDVMDEQDLPQRPSEYDAINFGDWRKLGMENILIGKLSLTDNGDYDVSFRLIDIYRGKQIAGFRIPAKPDLLRRAAHQISDIIFEKLTGIPGAFDTRVAYITVNKQKGKKVHALQIADADGHNAQVLLESPEPILSPSWSPDGKMIAYVSFEGKNSAIYVQNILTGQRERVAGFAGINSSPDWSPDGTRLAMTLSKDGNTEIYIMNLGDKSLRRLTRHGGIDTEPNWSPSGQKIAFTSDRSGGPQIYEISATGGEAKRITFEGKYNARAEYSPDGKFITLVHRLDGGSYRIGLLNLRNSSINVLTDARLDESPSFAPNGGMIIYATTGVRGGQLAAVSTDGQVHQRLGLQQGDVREPAWGPFLK